MLLDKSNGGDGIAVRKDINSMRDLKGKSIGVDAPGTSPFFVLAYLLKKNGMTMNDIKRVSLSPQAAANAFLAGQNDAAQTYEPFMSAIRDKPEAGCGRLHHTLVAAGRAAVCRAGKPVC